VRHRLQAYGVAAGAVVLALLVGLLAARALGSESAFLLFFAAVLLGAWYGGLGPGLFAVMTSTGLCAYFLLPPGHSFAGAEPQQRARLAMFFLEGILATALITALHRARARHERLFADSEARRRHAEMLADVGRLVSQSLDPEEVGRRVVDAVRSLLSASASALYRLDAASGDMIAVAVSGDVGPTFGRNIVFRQGTGVVGVALRERQPVATPDLFADPRVVLGPEVREHIERAPYRAVLAVPLLIHSRVTGALSVGDRAGRVFEREEIALAQAFADQAAIALENARLYEELRRSQGHLVKAERLRALGEMAAGVAHDFNNVLAVILGRAQLLALRPSDPYTTVALAAIEQAALDGAQTVRRILEFTRTRTTTPFGRVDLRAVLHEVVELTRPRWSDEARRGGIQYEVAIEGGRPEELREAFLNLLTNALEAMPEGGRCTLAVSHEAGQVVVRVRDTGSGMSPETQARIFEPFFTTKEPRGNGLGLAVTWGIVNRHHGTIEVDSASGAGTTFTVRLPVGGDLPAAEAPAVVAPPTGHARILVVEDEPGVRRVLVDLLTEHGYTVEEATDGAEGLRRCEASRFDLVITDISMPQASGWTIAEACQARFSLPVAMITGWGDKIEPGLVAEVLEQVAACLRRV